MPRHAPISRSVLSDLVKDRLLQAILAGQYPPGSRIIETRLAREFGTSQAPVREALRDLEALGVVEIAAFRGARVRRPSKAELLEAYSVRTELESLGARLAVPRMTDADLDGLRQFLDEMDRAAGSGDPHGEAIADANFHARIIELAGNATLERVWRYLEPFSRTYITAVVPGANLRWIFDLHPPILEALQGRDPEQAVVALRHHFVEAGTMLGRLWLDPDPARVGDSSAAGSSGPAGPGAEEAPPAIR
jgi:DNA-binding GntR family transcriptional regulator